MKRRPAQPEPFRLLVGPHEKPVDWAGVAVWFLAALVIAAFWTGVALLVVG